MSTQDAVDVLAVLDGDIEGMESVLPRARGKQREDLIAGIQQMREARAAVAALIAERDALLTALKCALPHVEHAYHTNPDPDGSFWVDVIGCRNVLARCGGAA